MSEHATDQSFVETTVRFRTSRHDLFGVITKPLSVPSRGIGVVLATGGAYIPAPNRNRLSVRMARRLADLGFSSIRFDYRGVGESDGDIEGYRLDRPFVEDLVGAAGVLAAAGAPQAILVGSCFGARTILAAGRLPEMIGAVLISTPVRDFEMGDNWPDRYARETSLPGLLRRALRPQVWRNLLAPRSREAAVRSRRLYTRTAALKLRLLINRLSGRRERPRTVSEAFRSGFAALLARRLPVLLLYGRDENFFEEFERARRNELGDVLRAHGETVTVETIDGVAHGFTSIAVQEDVMTRTLAWIQAHWAQETRVVATSRG